jgi:hypothetical protein
MPSLYPLSALNQITLPSPRISSIPLLLFIEIFQLLSRSRSEKYLFILLNVNFTNSMILLSQIFNQFINFLLSLKHEERILKNKMLCFRDNQERSIKKYNNEQENIEIINKKPNKK